ncbi:hypothetical protein WN944_005908 [Citrus x changshan-huyou]|uniref:Uncharacterized protein n=1 Tax=Citrus x changshan-huyou TaxID=2935761 RepID=A0AAP0MKT9_9ROSI
MLIYMVYFCSEVNLVSSMLYQVIFAYLIPVLIGILGANTQGRTEPLFKTHTINMWGFIVAKVIYCFALAADIKSRLHRENSSQLSGLVAVVSGSVSAVSLISTFLPPSIGHIILYTSWFFGATIVVLYQYGTLLMDACRRFHYDTLMLPFTRIWNWFQVN